MFPRKFDISDNEEKVFQLLLKVATKCQLSTNIRVAGGWVRNKLMGEIGGEIDIALEGITGKEFAKLLSAVEKGSVSFGIIRSNPEQSKHLETATVRLFGIPLDLVNLRGETYTASSRIPNMVNRM